MPRFDSLWEQIKWGWINPIYSCAHIQAYFLHATEFLSLKSSCLCIGDTMTQMGALSMYVSCYIYYHTRCNLFTIIRKWDIYVLSLKLIWLVYLIHCIWYWYLFIDFSIPMALINMSTAKVILSSLVLLHS
jgi:hypothetical protein